jgi:hypothetical protein
MSKGDDRTLGIPSKGKEKERERTLTPEPQVQNEPQGMPADLLRFIIGRHLDAAERKYGGLPYAAIEESDAKILRRPATEYEDFEDADFVPRMWDRHRDMFASQFLPSFRVPSRRPQPEFVTGPSRITLDDL